MKTPAGYDITVESDGKYYAYVHTENTNHYGQLTGGWHWHTITHPSYGFNTERDAIRACLAHKKQTQNETSGRLLCLRCGAQWWRRNEHFPKQCPVCGSARWQTPRTGNEPGPKPKNRIVPKKKPVK